MSGLTVIRNGLVRRGSKRIEDGETVFTFKSLYKQEFEYPWDRARQDVFDVRKGVRDGLQSWCDRNSIDTELVPLTSYYWGYYKKGKSDGNEAREGIEPGVWEVMKCIPGLISPKRRGASNRIHYGKAVGIKVGQKDDIFVLVWSTRHCEDTIKCLSIEASRQKRASLLLGDDYTTKKLGRETTEVANRIEGGIQKLETKRLCIQQR